MDSKNNIIDNVIKYAEKMNKIINDCDVILNTQSPPNTEIETNYENNETNLDNLENILSESQKRFEILSNKTHSSESLSVVGPLLTEFLNNNKKDIEIIKLIFQKFGYVSSEKITNQNNNTQSPQNSPQDRYQIDQKSQGKFDNKNKNDITLSDKSLSPFDMLSPSRKLNYLTFSDNSDDLRLKDVTNDSLNFKNNTSPVLKTKPKLPSERNVDSKLLNDLKEISPLNPSTTKNKKSIVLSTKRTNNPNTLRKRIKQKQTKTNHFSDKRPSLSCDNSSPISFDKGPSFAEFGLAEYDKRDSLGTSRLSEGKIETSGESNSSARHLARRLSKEFHKVPLFDKKNSRYANFCYRKEHEDDRDLSRNTDMSDEM